MQSAVVVERINGRLKISVTIYIPVPSVVFNSLCVAGSVVLGDDRFLLGDERFVFVVRMVQCQTAELALTLHIITDTSSQIGNFYFPTGYSKSNQLLSADFDPFLFEKPVHRKLGHTPSKIWTIFG